MTPWMKIVGVGAGVIVVGGVAVVGYGAMCLHEAIFAIPIAYYKWWERGKF